MLYISLFLYNVNRFLIYLFDFLGPIALPAATAACSLFMAYLAHQRRAPVRRLQNRQVEVSMA
jgi:hypothetical protein